MFVSMECFLFNFISAAAIDPCSCSDWHGCIMRSTVSGEDGIQPYKFSGCSVDQFQKWMDQGSALCLLNRPRNRTNFIK